MGCRELVGLQHGGAPGTVRALIRVRVRVRVKVRARARARARVKVRVRVRVSLWVPTSLLQSPATHWTGDKCKFRVMPPARRSRRRRT